MDQETTYVGIDVAKAQLDVAVRPSGDSWEVPHDEAGVRQLVSHLKALEPVTVLLDVKRQELCTSKVRDRQEL